MDCALGGAASSFVGHAQPSLSLLAFAAPSHAFRTLFFRSRTRTQTAV